MEYSSTRHWCHVMERESFEDEEVTALLNEHYIATLRQKWVRPGVMEMLTQIHDSWTKNHARITASSEKIASSLQPHFMSHSKGMLTKN